jgi:M6 family metalloprotease-like protein
VLVLLVQFLNQTGQTTAESWATRIFGNTNSVRDHYDASSLGLVSLTPANESHGPANDGVVGWLTLNYNHPNTGANTSDANQRIVRDALIAAEPYVNFAAFDTNGDGVVSASELLIVTVVAGNETAFGGTSSCSPGVWGHKWQIFAPPIVDGKSVGGSGYAQFGEMHCAASAPPGHPATIGVMAHEVGHLLGLPDLYDTDGSSEGIGNWSLMAGGTWNGVALVGDLPALLDPWSKYVLGWVTPIQVTDTLTNAMIPASAATATIYQLGTGSALTGTGEYFLVENRQQIDYDAALPAAGLLIWHIEESRFTNTSECIPGGLPACSASVHYKVALVQADNAYDLERRQNRGDGGDPFPGATGNRSLTGVSAPNSNLYGGTPSNASVTSISDSGDIMTATLSVLVGQPTVSASPASILPGGTLTVTWSGITSPSATDWLGLFQPGAPNTAYIDWIYVSCSKTPNGSGAAGSCSFVVPATAAPGTYQLRLLANDGYTLLATSNNVAVTSSGPTVSANPASILPRGTRP